MDMGIGTAISFVGGTVFPIAAGEIANRRGHSPFPSWLLTFLSYGLLELL